MKKTPLVPVFADDATWGGRLAPVTIVAFEDFQCPYCAKGAETLAKVQAEYGTEKLRVVFKNLPLPFHPNAGPAAEAAEGVRALGGNDAFWRFYAAAFAGQADLGPEAYATWAKAARASMRRPSPRGTRRGGRRCSVTSRLRTSSGSTGRRRSW